MTADFLKEITLHKSLPDFNRIVKCYGISRNPLTKEYIMVMDYMKEGDFRQYLQNNYDG